MITVSQIPEKAAQGEWGLPSGEGWLTRIAVKWKAFINFLVPLGYEDETGFHYGERTVPNADQDSARQGPPKAIIGGRSTHG